MHKLDQTDPRIQLRYEDFLEPDLELPKPTLAPRIQGTSRVVEMESGRKVVLKDTAGRTGPEGEEAPFESFDGEPFRSNSGLFGSSKIQFLRGLLARPKSD